MPGAEIGSALVRQGQPAATALGPTSTVPRHGARSSIVAAVFAVLALDVLMLVAACDSASATTWRLNSPERPAAGENAPYLIRGPAGAEHSGTVNTGARVCPQSGLTGDPSETSSWDGYLNEGGVDSRQVSFARGRSTICVYDDASPNAVVRKVIRSAAGRDRLRISAAPIEFPADGLLLVTATGYVGRIGDPTYLLSAVEFGHSPPPVPKLSGAQQYYSDDVADQHVGTVVVNARPHGRPCPERPLDESAVPTASADIDDARFSAQITISDALQRSDRPVLCAYLTAVRRALADLRPRTVARASVRYSADSTATTGKSSQDDDTGLWLPGLILLPLGFAVWALLLWGLFVAARGLGCIGIGLMSGRGGRSREPAGGRRPADDVVSAHGPPLTPTSSERPPRSALDSGRQCCRALRPAQRR